MKIANRAWAVARFLWNARTFVLVVIVMSSAASTALYVISTDYLDHRRGRAAAMEAAHEIIKKKEAELVRLLTETTPMWKRGDPIPKDLQKELAVVTADLYSAIDGLNNPTDQSLKVSRRFRDAVANLRNSLVSYRHDEETVRAMHAAIKVYAINRDEFHTVFERQLKDYSKTVIGSL